MPAAPLRSIVFLSVHLAVLAMAAPAHAASLDAPAARSIELPAGPLGRNLSTLAVEAGIALSFDPALTAGLSSPPLSGSYTAREALTRLLAGSGLEVTGRSDGSYTLQKAAPAAATSAGAAASAAGEQTLAAIRVRARRAADGSTEGTGSYTSRVTSIASKGDQSFREIPQSVSVITRQQLDDQKLTGIGQVMGLTPGVTVQRMNASSFQFYSRGFQIDSMQVDGGAPMNIASFSFSNAMQDMAFYDRVEVMRGASGLLGGVGDPGGIINLARKKPLAQRQVLASLSGGSWNDYRTELDVTGPLAFDGKLRGRMVAVYGTRDSHLEHISSDKRMLYGVLEADVGADGLATVGAMKGRRNDSGTGDGLPRYSNGVNLDLPRNASLTQPWAYNNLDSTEVFAQFEQRLARQWKLKLNMTRARQSLENQGAFAYGAIAPGTRDGAFWVGSRISAENRQDMLDLNLAGNFTLWGRTHELLLGVDRQKVTSYWNAASVNDANVAPVNVFDPASTPWVDHAVGEVWRRYNPWSQEQQGAYGTLRLHPSDQLHVIIGARSSKYKFNQVYEMMDLDTHVWSVASASRYSEPRKVTGYGGVIYDLTPQWSAYASYAEIYKPQALYRSGPMPGVSLKPVTGKSYEGGVKGELANGALNATFSVFHVERNGEAVSDPAYPRNTQLYSGQCCYLPKGKVTSRGVDMEVGGEVLPDWQLSAGYTYNHTRDETSNLPYSSITPKHLFKLSTVYTLPGTWSQWKVGGNASIRSAQFVSGELYDAAGNGTPFDFKQGGYGVLGAMLQYRIDAKWTVALNVDNLLDKVYYDRIGDTGGGNFYGTPRSVALTLRGAF